MKSLDLKEEEDNYFYGLKDLNFIPKSCREEIEDVIDHLAAHLTFQAYVKTGKLRPFLSIPSLAFMRDSFGYSTNNSEYLKRQKQIYENVLEFYGHNCSKKAKDS